MIEAPFFTGLPLRIRLEISDTDLTKDPSTPNLLQGLGVQGFRGLGFRI